MKKTFLGIYLLLITMFNTSAQVDYNYCSKFIEDTNANIQKTGFSFPFSIDPKTGKLKTTNYKMSYNGESKGKHIYSSNGWAGSIKVVLREEESSKVSNIEIERITNRAGSPTKVTTVIDFEIKNDKCIPKIGKNTVKINGFNVVTTLFDTKLCRNLQNYFGSNKALNKCFDTKSKENKAMESLLEKSGYDTTEITKKMASLTPVLSRYNYSVEQKILTGTSKTFDFNSMNSDEENRKMLGLLGGSPLISGYMILNDCHEKGLKEVSLDENVWRVKEIEIENDSSKQKEI